MTRAAGAPDPGSPQEGLGRQRGGSEPGEGATCCHLLSLAGDTLHDSVISLILLVTQ